MTETTVTRPESALAMEMIVATLDAHFEHRYAGYSLRQLASARVLGTEADLARHLRAWREAEGWPHFDVIGAVRCVSCHKIMGDESSACEDETVCLKCATS